MKNSINRLSAVGLHGRFDVDVAFSEGVNIVHGANGAGKTTLLHILTNAANLDIRRFNHLTFGTIRLELEGGQTIEIIGEPSQSSRRNSDVKLFIDGEHIVDWPLKVDDQDPEFERSIFRKRILEARAITGIDVEVTYFPAFRTMIEAWYSLYQSDRSRQGFLEPRALPRSRRRRSYLPSSRRAASNTPTRLAREVFGPFVPSINYPSPREIEHQLDREIQRAVNRLATEDRAMLSNVFTLVFDAISQEPGSGNRDNRTVDDIRTSISEKLEEIQSTEREYGLPENNSAFVELKSRLESPGLSSQGRTETTTVRILEVYEEVLIQRATSISQAFRAVRDYIDAVNDFLEGKQLVTAEFEDDAIPRLQIRHDDDMESPLDALSSGERQVVGLIYSASRVTAGNVILVDEPELSLHIDWQQKIIHSMMQQMRAKQLIVCTHSPVIASDYADEMIKLKPTPTQWEHEQSLTDYDEPEIWVETVHFEDIEHP